MTLDKAIDIATIFRDEGCGVDEHDLDDSLTLLMEAGNRILRQRTLAVPVHQPPLPGEDIV